MIRVSVVKLRDDVDGILANATKTSSNFECDSLAAESTLTLLCAFLLQPFQEKGEVMERSTVGTISSLGRCTNFDKAALHAKSERPWKMPPPFPTSVCVFGERTAQGVAPGAENGPGASSESHAANCGTAEVHEEVIRQTAQVF